MPVLPQFSPAQAPNTLANLSNQSQNDQQSWMDQAQNRQLKAAQEDRTQQIYQLGLPAMQATSEANRLTAQGKLDQMTIVQGGRAQAAKDATNALQEFLDVPNGTTDAQDVDENGDPIAGTGGPNWEDQHQAYNGLAAQYANLAMYPEHKQLWDTISNAAKSAGEQALKTNVGQIAIDKTNRAKAADFDRMQMEYGIRQQIAAEQNATKKENTQTTVEGKKTNADTGADSRARVEQMKVYNDQAYDADRAASAETDAPKKAALQKRADDYRAKIDDLAAMARQAVEQPAPQVTFKTPLPPQDARNLPPGSTFVGTDGKTYRVREQSPQGP